MNKNLKPNHGELEFLNLAYHKFYKIYDEVMDDSFWQKEAYYRFSRIKDGFAVYVELLNYEPIQWVIEHIRINRPQMEAEIGSELFKFIRNVIMHFPFFDSWEEIWIKKSIINWDKDGQTIDKFLKKYSGKETIKYRFWEPTKKKMTYLDIRLPLQYGDEKIFLKEFLTEKEGVKFSFILMKKILDTQTQR
ncbi:hypothetical protein IT413_05780 [Candidatus Peregrinibacteria bacterium]|nr:hypothetical protein [Candidatus Peregrinibacteria bacterium]